MKILYKNNDLIEALKNVSKLGFVPTMGSLHEGHFSLITQSKKQCSKTIVSIFINPTQFDNKSDFKKYPKNHSKDLLALKKLNVDFVYLPNVKDIYNNKRKLKIKISKKDKILCAKFRKGHFEGVIDVMDRLTNLIRPAKIFMGEKDFQQLYLVKNYIEKKYSSLIVNCKTIRNKFKLALSSRNLLLNRKDLILAGKLSSHLIFFKKSLIKKTHIKKLLNTKKEYLKRTFNISIEYIELRNMRSLKMSNKIKNSKIFIAYYLNGVRLIDNF